MDYDQSVIVTKSKLLKDISGPYLCTRIGGCVRQTKNEFMMVYVDEKVVVDFMLTLLSREMGVPASSLSCDKVNEEFKSSVGFFAYINQQAAEYIKNKYQYWLYGEVRDKIITSHEFIGTTVRYTGRRYEFLNALIGMNMRDDEVITVPFYTQALNFS